MSSFQDLCDWQAFWDAWYDLPVYMKDHENRIDEEEIVDEDGSSDYTQFTYDEVQQFRDYLATLDSKFDELERSM